MPKAPDLAGLTLRGYEPGDETSIVELFTRVYKRPLTVDRWRWKLKSRPARVENIWLVFDGPRLVFQYAGIPMRFLAAGKERDFILSVDTMTDPDYQRRGLLTSVGRFTYDTWAQAGLALVYGLPNERWGTRTDALGIRKLFSVTWRLRALRPEALAAKRKGLGALRSVNVLGPLLTAAVGPRADAAISVRELSAAGPEVDALWSSTAPRPGVMGIHDAAFVRWRYLEAEPKFTLLLAERAGTPVGWAAYRLSEKKGERYGVLAEVFAPGDERAWTTLLRAVIDRLAAAGATHVLALSAPGNPIDRRFARAGFVTRKNRFSLETALFAEDLSFEALADPAGWHLSGGDFDVV